MPKCRLALHHARQFNIRTLPSSPKFLPCYIFLLTYSHSFPSNSSSCLGCLSALIHTPLRLPARRVVVCTMHLLDFVLFMTLVTPLALAGPRGTLFQAHQLRPIPVSFVFMTLSLLLTTGIGNSFFRRTGDGVSLSFLTYCRVLCTLPNHFWPILCTRITI